MSWVAPFDVRSHVTWLRIGVAVVWLLFGLLFKALGAVPRHRQIVERVVGSDRAGLVLWMVALGEISLGIWMLVGIHLRFCMIVQTALIAAMNTLELLKARDLLLSPIAMLCANALFLSLGWYVAVAAP
jgi:hypothetical protein